MTGTPVHPSAHSSAHIAVLLDEVMAALALAEGDIYVDGTFGAGGYTRAALDYGIGHAWAFDRDPSAIANGAAMTAEFDGRLTLLHHARSLGMETASNAALARAGGVAAIAGALIDDCAMGRAMKAQGPVRLALTHRSQSIRPYGSWREIGAMIARSAYAQLGYSPLLLAGTLIGITLIYLAPPLLALFAHGPACWLGLAAWLLMAVAFQPMLRFYRRSPLWGVALPAIGAFYAGATFVSAWQHRQGRGGLWKGRPQAQLQR